MMLRMGAVTATYMIIAITGIRAALRTAEAPKVTVVPQPLRVAILLRAQRAVALLQTVRNLIHPAAVLQRRIRVLWILMMMATMRFMRTMITTGIATGAMMTMLPVWMMPWKMKIGKLRRELLDKSIWKQCKRKNRYRDEHTANLYRRKFEQERGKKLDYYWCPYCNGFHLTSAEINTKDYDFEETGRQVVAVG